MIIKLVNKFLRLLFFFWASKHGHDSIVTQLIEKNADINFKDCHGDTALILGWIESDQLSS
jgi:ankyrin repeat protein